MLTLQTAGVLFAGYPLTTSDLAQERQLSD
jgi:hypothetical protein